MKILLFLVKGFEMTEIASFIDVFGWNKEFMKMDTQVITCGFNKEVNGTFNIPIRVDKLFEELDISEYDALAIPGGFGYYGFYEEAYDERLLSLIKSFDEDEKPIASVCVGAFPIAKSGVLNGRNGTTYHLMDGLRQRQIEKMGVVLKKGDVVIDKNIITSWCPATAPEVALNLLEMLTSKENTDKIRIMMGY